MNFILILILFAVCYIADKARDMASDMQQIRDYLTMTDVEKREYELSVDEPDLWQDMEIERALDKHRKK